jgi:hypothetical protein
MNLLPKGTTNECVQYEAGVVERSDGAEKWRVI